MRISIFSIKGAIARLHKNLGAHRLQRDGVWETYFAVWAPDAERVFVTGDFTGWDKESNGFIPEGTRE